jgi:hypothetical protein
MDLKQFLSTYSHQPISTQTLLGLLRDYSRPYDKIVELVNQGYLLQIRKGLYMVSSMIGNSMPEPFLIANHLYGPSYISQDSALFHWGLIPERVYEITSVTTKLSKRIFTQNISFSFTHLPKTYYAIGIQSLALTQNQTVLIASPEKCLCDKIILTANVNLRSVKQAMLFLLEDLRIDKDNLRNLNVHEIVKWLSVCPKKNSIKMLTQAIATL